ncbi:type II toxin-antitoxin system VapC family toxin [Candidatus Peregrinibacteria bacterium]|jgi:predicted nucleic acid-binding protein|nr:type II toxin-antitoxin system VapC family toxin [Candidatus Peregrinibacteria bacterium]
MAKNKFEPSRFIYKTVVLDASVLVKVFFEERGSEEASELLKYKMQGVTTVLATPLMIFEFLNIVSRKAEDREQALEIFKRFKEFGIGLLEPGDDYVEEAIAVVHENPEISYYDASYHALAKDLDTVFLTADKKFYNAMKGDKHIELFG